MSTFVKSIKTEDTQKIATFTGEGAYHGSSKVREDTEALIELPPTISKYLTNKSSSFENFQATFPNYYKVKRFLKIPSQEEIKNDGVTFMWTPFEEALQEAGPITRNVLQEMEPFLKRDKKFIYIDSKIQFFRKNDLPVDSNLWHIDGSLAIRDSRIKELGFSLLHDLKARLTGDYVPNNYLAYQSSYHCATEFAYKPIYTTLPECIPSFDILDQKIKKKIVLSRSQPAGSIVAFNGLSLHRAVPASEDGWRLWVRCIETDREVKMSSDAINCYGTVFRQE